jgi:hypothetical protein|tara:strand:- start:685 stop:1353 length:669 start_codon:yes stop_codon:yes gene_type:complete
MTKKEIIYQVLEKLNIHSDDARITEELVSSFIDTKRAMLLKQQYSKSAWNVPADTKQELCLSLSLVDKVDGYSCAGKILTTEALPASIKIKGKEGPLLVRKEDGSVISLSTIAVERVPYLFQNRYLQNITYCAIDLNGKLLIISNNDKHKFLKNIKVTDVFESPEEALKYECDYDSSVDSWDIEYPCELAMVDVMVELITKDLVKTLSIPGDNKNDALDDRR